MMHPNEMNSLEAALTTAASGAEALKRAVSRLLSSAKALEADMKAGALRDLPRRWEALQEGVTLVQQELTNAKGRWRFDIREYTFEMFVQELVTAAQNQGVHLVEQDRVLFCFPALVRVNLDEPSVQIDKRKHTRIRPTVIVEELKRIQKRPPRFRPAAFLDTLFAAYRILNRGFEQRAEVGPTLRLRDVYDLLVLRQGQDREYTLQEFARDLYLLDQSAEVETRSGYRLALPASTGTRGSRSALTVITPSNQEKRYYGIQFTKITGLS